MAELNVGDHVWFDRRPVTVVAQRDDRIWYVPGHVEYLDEDAEHFRLLGSGW